MRSLLKDNLGGLVLNYYTALIGTDERAKAVVESRCETEADR